MDHIGVDVHKRESQISIFAEGVRSAHSGSVPSPGASPPCWEPGPVPGC